MNVIDILEKKSVIKILLYLKNNKLAGYCKIQSAIEINTTTLASRLQYLEEENVIDKKVCDSDSRCVFYSLSKTGLLLSEELEKLLGKFKNIT